MIKIQKKDFYIEKEINNLKTNYKNAGAVSSFIGYVRNTNKSKKVVSIYLEVYQDMAKKKWEILDCIIIHRHGKLIVGDKIVLFAVIFTHFNPYYLG